VEHLARDQVEEADAGADRQQALRLRETHAGPEPAVQLEDDGTRSGLATGRRVALEARELGQALDRLDRALRNQRRAPVADVTGGAQEGPGRDLRELLPTHPLGEAREHRVVELLPGPISRTSRQACLPERRAR